MEKKITITVAEQGQKREYHFSAGEYSWENSLPLSITVEQGLQAVLYQEPGFQGNSQVFSGHLGRQVFPLSDSCLTQLGSLRVLETEVLSGEERDKQAVQEAVNGWWQRDLLERKERLDWWREARFGCFVHWGVYSLAGGVWNGKHCGYAEHLQRAMKIDRETYLEKLIKPFSPDAFDADNWIRLIRDAGMKYFIITAKHHDGFAMYPSQAYPFDLRMSSWKRDPMRELQQACQKYGLKFGFYYSHAFDWEHPDAPGNDWEYTNGGGDKHLFEGEKGLWFQQHPELLPRTARYYVDQKSIPQILELIQNYHPDILWFDTPHKLPLSENLRILKAIREADPQIVVNGRLARMDEISIPSFADYCNTADRPAEIFPTDGDWEGIPTTNESYGYSAYDKTHKSPTFFIQLAAKMAARGGNMLLNIGPDAQGNIDAPDVQILQEIGKWFSSNGESIHQTSRSPLDVQSWGETTQKGNTLYLHVFDLPEDGNLVLAGLLNPVSQATLLSDPQQNPLPVQRLNYYDTLISLPKGLSPSADTVVKVSFSGEIQVYKGRLLLPGQTFLRAFDASHVGAGLEHGDGKRNQDYLCNFSVPSQTVNWKIRIHQPLELQISVKYSTLSSNPAGRYTVSVGSHTETCAIQPSGGGESPLTDRPLFFSIGGAGTHSPLDAQLEQEIQIHLENGWEDGFHLYGIQVTAVKTAENAGQSVQKDDTEVE